MILHGLYWNRNWSIGYGSFDCFYMFGLGGIYYVDLVNMRIYFRISVRFYCLCYFDCWRYGG